MSRKMNEWFESLHTKTRVGCHVWFSRIQQKPDTYRRYYNLLDEIELDRYHNLYFLKDKKRFVVSRGFSKMILSKYADLEPSEITLWNDSLGKPFQNGHRDLQISLSHSGNLFTLAISQQKRVGVDIEYIKRKINLQNMSMHFLNAKEKKTLETCVKTQKKRVFYEYWTKKEALIKATGEKDFKKINIPLNLGTDVVDINDSKGNPSSWVISPLNTSRDYVGTLVCENRSLYRIGSK